MKERLCLKIWGRECLRKMLGISFGPTSTGVQECSHTFEHVYTHTRSLHMYKYTKSHCHLTAKLCSQLRVDYWVGWAQLELTWEMEFFLPSNAELWNTMKSPFSRLMVPWMHLHTAFIGFDWHVCLVNCTQFQVLNDFCEARFTTLGGTTAVKVSLDPSSGYMNLLRA